MDGLVILGIAIFLVWFVLPIRNAIVISDLRRALDLQKRQIDALKRAEHMREVERDLAAAQPIAEDSASPVRRDPAEPMPGPFAPVQPIAATSVASEPTSARKTEAPATLERQFGGRAFVWLGGVALALAGFFLVKYSIDIGLLTETVRCVLGVLFGLVLLGASQYVRARKGLADGVRIAQALAGAGIADLYGSLFAATTLYHLVPNWLGFAAMAATTAVALVLSLRHGSPIAVLGLVGGYATPMMIQGEPNAPVLFGYLYLVFAGLSVVIRRQGWRWLSIPASLVAFAWVALWLFTGAAAKDGAALSLFLLGLAATSAFAERDETVASFSPAFWLRNIAPAGVLALMAGVTFAANYSLFEWSVFGLFSAGAIALAWFDSRTYVLAPWLAFAANALMMLAWSAATPASLAIAIVGFAVLFAGASLILLDRSQNTLTWAALATAALLVYFALAYGRLDAEMHRLFAGQADAIWALIAFAAAAILGVTSWRGIVVRHARAELLQTVLAGGAAALIAGGLLILLGANYRALAIAAELLAAAYLAARMPVLRHIAQALAALFGLLMLPELGRLFESTMTAFGIAPPDIVTIILCSYALPAALVAGTSVLLRRASDDPFVKSLELLVIGLIGLMSFRVVEYGFQGSPATLVLYAGGILDDILLLLSLAALRFSRTFGREAALWGAAALGGCAVMRIVGVEFLLENPIMSHVSVGTTPLVSGLLIAYGLPAVLGLAIAGELTKAKLAQFAFAARIAAFVLGFVYLTLSVRQIYLGEYLDLARASDAEIYTYSAVWLVAGVALLFAAVLRRDMTMRVASLAVLLLTVGKVFLYDASALTGLWRVVSFLGLGLSLLGLSWFYTRFVFVDATPPEAA